MTERVTALLCAGCGAVPADDVLPFRCARAVAGDGVDHVVARVLDTTKVRFPEADEPNPFVRYRTLLHSRDVALAGGLSDADFVAIVERLDRAIATTDGAGFRVTPFAPSDALAGALGLDPSGAVWVKDETGNVSGSHKARHLMGIALYLDVAERLGRLESRARPTLAIASCGNAALAAAVVAKAAGRPLDVFIPPDANRTVIARLEELGARLTVCGREAGQHGDPCYLRFCDAVANGALPFGCQGPDNGLAIEGGETLGYEMVSALRAGGARLDRVFVQVGGGALASATLQAFTEAAALGAVDRLPRVHAVQTRGAYPLRRAWDRLTGRILQRVTREPPAGDAERADLLLSPASGAAIADGIRHAATHRHEFMWPWEDEPRSVAHGILDDETYDWLAIVKGLLATGGWPIVVDEPALIEANEVARRTTGIAVDPTGSSGLAGLMQAKREGHIAPRESVAVLFTGRLRSHYRSAAFALT